jgi:hypothetical protein
MMPMTDGEDPGWPEYDAYLRRLQAVADAATDIPPGNRGAGMFAVAVSIMRQTMNAAEVVEWLQHQAAGFGEPGGAPARPH